MQLEKETISELQSVADLIEKFPVGFFADENKRGLALFEYSKLTNRLLGGIRLLSDDSLNATAADLKNLPTKRADAFSHFANVQGVIVALRDHLAALARANEPVTPFIDPKTLDELRGACRPGLDFGKLVRMCEELNDCYARENYVACALLIRAMMNHVPPVFGFHTFKEVAAHSGKSAGAAFKLLEGDARIVADLHNHATMRAKEPLPTRAQIEPFQSSFELLLHEIIAKREVGGAQP